MTKSAYNDEALDKIHVQSRLENMLHPEREGASEREFGMMEVMDDDEHLSRLRNIATESIFIDLLNTDEFLKKQDPEAVLEAYNDVIEVNPSIRGKKMALRQALREYMATESLDLATIGQLEKMENDAATRRDAKEKTMAEQASRFAQNQEKRQQDARELEMKKRDMEMRASEAKERAKQFDIELKRKKKEMKTHEKEFKAMQEERKEQFNYQKEQDRTRNELASQQFEHQKDQDKKRNDLANEQFTHQKEQDRTRNQLAQNQFDYQKEQDSTRNQLAQNQFNYQKEQDTQKNQREQTKLENQVAMDNFNARMQQIAEKARQMEAELALAEKAEHDKKTLEQKDRELNLRAQEAQVTLMQALSQIKDDEAARIALSADPETPEVVREYLRGGRLEGTYDDPILSSPWWPDDRMYTSPLNSFVASSGVGPTRSGATPPTTVFEALNPTPVSTTMTFATPTATGTLNPSDVDTVTLPTLRTTSWLLITNFAYFLLSIILYAVFTGLHI